MELPCAPPMNLKGIKMIEIEKKFFVKSNKWWENVSKQYSIVQGYIANQGGNSVRVRSTTLATGDRNKDFEITIKGKKIKDSCPEHSISITENQFDELLELCGSRIIQKMRSIVIVNGRTWEIDNYANELSDLTIAEIEFKKPEDIEIFEKEEKPYWLGKEITDPQYANAALAEIAWVPINKTCGDILSIAEFRSSVECGAYTDDDGDGYYSTYHYESNISVWSSIITKPAWATHVIWYNK